MELDYSGTHSINFFKIINGVTSKKNTWKDFHLIPKKRPKINYPDSKFFFVNLPGTSKRLDITDFHIGGQTFGNRNGTWDFYIDHSDNFNWSNIPYYIRSFINGSDIYLTLSDEPNLFYKGIVTIDSYKPGSTFSEISLKYDLDYDTFIGTEDGLLESAPIKFIASNNIPYYGDYAISSETNYVTDLGEDGIKVLVYDILNTNSSEGS